MTARETVRADQLSVGDWTFYDQYRQVQAIKLHPRLRTVRVVTSAGARTFPCSQPILRRPA